jgi:putative endonuclease
MSGGFIAVYIMASRRHGTLYVGVTSELPVRIAQHREGTLEGFTKRYSVKLLVWFEEHADIATAIHREKLIKKYKREWKINLIERENPDWDDLYPRLFL